MVSTFEQRSSRKAMIISLGVHAILLVLLFFLVAWRAPNPPHPEYGIVLNFGLDVQGTGSIQPTTPVGAEQSESNEAEIEEVEEQSTPQETAEQEDVSESMPVNADVVSKIESPEVVEEKKDSKPAPTDVEKRVEETPAKKEEIKPKEDPAATYKPNTPSDSKGTASDRSGEPGSHGDNKAAVGDKGDSQGSLDSEALYGKQGGGGGGPSLQLAGWDWDHIPDARIPDNESSGRIVFTIEVNEHGELIRYRKESGTVSAAAERAFVEAIQKLTFTKKSGAVVPPVSRGRITFVIRAE